ncbi:MAG TPA: acyl-CoA dehydrogenase family protein [Kofleriaceae bacterium]|nr:acyl-CoA dehydrogenase family protein [Kofleriaceae bacterium]
MSLDALVRCLLDRSLVPPDATTPRAWWDATLGRRAAWATPIDRAIVGGVCADRIGFAFTGGYAEALRALVPDLPADAPNALCATEEGGAHPRAIQTRLEPAGDGFTLTGRKKWATLADEAGTLLVVAATGEIEGGKHRLRVARVSTRAPGVTLAPAAAAFVPEIRHAEVTLDRVAVRADDLLPGDGYDRYLKPFRTVEDLHVHGALLGYLVGVAHRHGLPRELVERLLAAIVTTRVLAAEDSRAATTHVVLAGLLATVTPLVGDVEAAWSATGGDEWQRWQRDRGLLQVAGRARAARREAAWSAVDW